MKMARDKARDDKFFNCSESHEHDYVAGLYSVGDRPAVRKLLKDACADNRIKNSTHMEVYELIKAELGLPIPI